MNLIISMDKYSESKILINIQGRDEGITKYNYLNLE